MIYLDNAATTYPKPESVIAALNEAVRKYGANPGRSGHCMASLCSEKLYDCRKTVGKFFGLDEPERVIFTPGCTWSINMALKGVLRPGDHVIISDMEHNAVVRPLRALEGMGITASRARVVEGDAQASCENFKKLIRRNTRLIFTTHASNVFGVKLPIEQLSQLCAHYDILFGVDAAQTAGLEPIDLSRIRIDLLCVPAHKGLYGVMGQGALLLGGDIVPKPLTEGGTGSLSKLRTQPEELPDRLESGTLNMPGICAMAAGIGFIEKKGRESIRLHELALVPRLYDLLRGVGAIELYTARPADELHVPLLSFNLNGIGADRLGELLSERGIAVRAGYHCAYDAHMKYSTSASGTVRVCPSAFTTPGDINTLAFALADIARKIY